MPTTIKSITLLNSACNLLFKLRQQSFLKQFHPRFRKKKLDAVKVWYLNLVRLGHGRLQNLSKISLRTLWNVVYFWLIQVRPNPDTFSCNEKCWRHVLQRTILTFKIFFVLNFINPNSLKELFLSPSKCKEITST